MADKATDNDTLSMPIVGMLLLGIFGGLIAAAGFAVIPYWPLPQGSYPYFGADIGFLWGAIVGGINGLVIGYIVDDSHFQEVAY